MTRRNRRQPIGIALFPFLAVLICTMGALIVLLVLTVQQARKSAVAEQAARALEAVPKGPSQDELDRIARLKQERDDALWRREILEQSRTQAQEEFARARDELSHLEGHIRELQDKARALISQAQKVDSGKNLDNEELEKARQEAERLKAEIARREAELLEKSKTQTGEQWYALLPYDGPNGTRRRPIYIECSDQGIVVQPEGIALSPEDFQGPMGPGNPLDAVLRAIREHLARNSGGAKVDPYPLLVVRPSGVVAYSVARSAMKSWEDEFGYELVDDETKLAYGQPDPALVATLEREVGLARNRQKAFAASMPRRYQEEEPLTSFSTSSLDGFDPLAAGGPAAAGGSGLGMGTGARTQYAAGGGSNGASGGPYGGTGSGNGMQSGGGNSAAQGDAAAGNYAGGAPNSSGVAGGNLAAGGTSASSGNISGTAGSQGQQPSAGQPSGGQTGASAGSQQAASGQSSGSSGSQSASSGAPQQSASASASRGSNRYGQTQRGSGGGASRGSNWGLPNSAGKATAITRPIRVLVLTDRVVLLPERGDSRAAEEIALSPEVSAQEIDAMVASIQRRIQSWGLAVNNGYWKPVLAMEVSGDAQLRVAQLEQALEGSGFELQRKQR